MLDGSVIRKEILLMGSKRDGGSASEVIRDTEALEITCIEFFYR